MASLHKSRTRRLQAQGPIIESRTYNAARENYHFTIEDPQSTARASTYYRLSFTEDEARVLAEWLNKMLGRAPC